MWGGVRHYIVTWTVSGDHVTDGRGRSAFTLTKRTCFRCHEFSDGLVVKAQPSASLRACETAERYVRIRTSKLNKNIRLQAYFSPLESLFKHIEARLSPCGYRRTFHSEKIVAEVTWP